MLALLGYESIEGLIADAVPLSIRNEALPGIGEGLTEVALLERLRSVAAENRVSRSYLGMAYQGTITPPVILRNILENPGWYTQYTPYQAEISQGRLEALLNFQTVVADLTGLPVANASLLDESTAAAEAMSLFLSESTGNRRRLLMDRGCHPQTIEVVRTRARPLGVEVVVGSPDDCEIDDTFFGALFALPATDGEVRDPRAAIRRAHEAGALAGVVADLLTLTLLAAPGELGADLSVGTTQRFGVPMGYGGPHAAYMAVTEALKRALPGRIVGVSRDVHGNPALRMALQTREQHIRREKATSNICTAQVLLAVMASMYAVYHGPEGLRRIALRIHDLTRVLAHGLEKLGHVVLNTHYFDTLRVRARGAPAPRILADAREAGINLRDFGDGTIGIALDETVETGDVRDLLAVFGTSGGVGVATNPGEPAGPEFLVPDARDLFLEVSEAQGTGPEALPPSLRRTTPYLEQPVFNRYHSETELLRYLHRLESRDLSLTTSMIPLGSCTMKLNAAAEMIPLSWPAFSSMHPFAPADQAAGYHSTIRDLERWLCAITGLPAVSLQPNSGAQGEYTGLLVIRAYHREKGESARNICLIPSSAHGTNPASAVMAGMQVVVVRCDESGSVDLEDLRAKADTHAGELAALMITYPSTHGVFEEGIRRVTEIVHERGGQVYLDGANLNAQVGICRPGDYGADVCHINLHKTFAIPHGGGGPGMGPICVAEHLAPFLPHHPVVAVGGDRGIGAVSAAPWGSASVLVISWAYIALLGREGLRRATETAILNANYMAKRLEGHFPVLYRGKGGWVAHEFILDLRPLKKSSGVTEEDVAKRLMDYGFHAPTMAFPVPGTIMVEPTESESLDELDRFCDALVAIREEIRQIEAGLMDRSDNLLKNAPHTLGSLLAETWDHPYSRERAGFPAPWTRDHKCWPSVGRVDNAYGDRNLVCTCPPIESYAVAPGVAD